jgi:hypothetical protein
MESHRADETLRSNPDHGEWVSRKLYDRSNHLRIATEPLLPQLEAEDDN